MTLLFDIVAIFIALIFFVGVGVVLYVFRCRRENHHIAYSSLDVLTNIPSSVKERLIFIPRLCYFVALAFFVIAFIDPHLVGNGSNDIVDGFDDERYDIEPLPTEGIALYLVLDCSSSMLEKLSSSNGNISRIAALKDTTKKFIAGDRASGLPGHGNDMIGIIRFARVATVVAPLTLDHGAILDNLDDLDVVQYRDEDGTAIGYAIFKTANLIAATKHFSRDLIGDDSPSYDIKNTVIVVVTDGIQHPSPLDAGHPLREMSLSAAAQYAGDNDIKTYIIDIEPIIRHPRYSLQRKALHDAAEATGGKLFIADNIESLQNIYSEIDALETSELPGGEDTVIAIHEDVVVKDEAPRRHKSYYHGLIGAGLVMLLFAVFSEALFFRRTL
ncbi:MAG: VWA domain-containing protein [Waddliaceae bacterium]|jgi:Ca-activated chloride channel homolog|nr:VWA domain-containing protein [Waddliaceae bacterium]MBT3579150.1 VWA domain-containing protein [Waddliaceae bacterium]MBT4444306.1 VWA domain-containing protein [Waddliaceae bacterium]MBT6928521.1 VWA domain-containing protein [Waddliaceae bacterium]MBT7264859.1 VWA domain-containing protein [Waddliaceae bacterium]